MERLRQLIGKHGLGEFEAEILALARPCVRVRATSGVIGRSWFGGTPRGPSGFKWPKPAGNSLSHLARIDLSEASLFDATGLLPKRGVLVFWYDLDVWGFDPADAGGSLVEYYEDPSEHGEVDVSQAAAQFKACPLAFEAGVTLPNEEWLVEHESANGAAQELAENPAYGELVSELNGEGHWMLGHPSPQQWPMELECQLTTNGLYCGDSTGYQDLRAMALGPNARDWRLLFQIATDDAPGWTWGDMGSLYFWAKEQDLRAGRFDRTWMILQCG